MKRFSEISNTGYQLAGERVSITSLYNIEIIFKDFIEKTIRNESKIIVQFNYTNKPGDFVFITRSDVMKDKLTQFKSELPFIGTITKVKEKYITIQ
jgi:hypothetical protein